MKRVHAYRPEEYICTAHVQGLQVEQPWRLIGDSNPVRFDAEGYPAPGGNH
jgi:hypothetical protein